MTTTEKSPLEQLREEGGWDQAPEQARVLRAALLEMAGAGGASALAAQDPKALAGVTDRVKALERAAATLGQQVQAAKDHEARFHQHGPGLCREEGCALCGPQRAEVAKAAVEATFQQIDELAERHGGRVLAARDILHDALVAQGTLIGG